MLFLETDNHVKHTNCTPNKQKPTTVSLFLNSNSELKMLKDIMESFIDRGESTLLINKFTNKSSNDQYVHRWFLAEQLSKYLAFYKRVGQWWTVTRTNFVSHGHVGQQLAGGLFIPLQTSGAHNRKKPLKTTTTTILLLMKKRMRLMRCFQCISAGSG